MITLGKFAKRIIDDFGGEILESPLGSLAASDEVVTRLRWIVRTDEFGKRRVASIPNRMTPQTTMADNLVRSYCVQLGIPPSAFGL